MDAERAGHIVRVATELTAAGVASATFDARVLVDLASPLDAAGRERLERLVAKRAMRVPLQLLVGRTGFRLIDVQCVPGVFIPRPETEILVGVVLQDIASRVHPCVIEPCVGTGAISASLVAEHDTVQIVATDINPDAVTIARQNIAQVLAGEAGVPKRPDTACAQVEHGSLFQPVPPHFAGATDVIVCNPPYLPEHVFDALPAEVRDHDPYAALVGGKDGHEILQEVFDNAHIWLRSGGLVAVEVDATRLDDACDRAVTAGLVAVDSVADLTETRRFVTARCR